MYYIFEDWSNSDYTFLYKCIIGFFILFGTSVLKLLQDKRKRFLINDHFLLLVLVTFLVFIFGTRGKTIGTDTINYYNNYYLNIVNLTTLAEQWHAIQTSFLFKVVFVFTNGIKSYHFFLFIVALIMNSAWYFFVRKFTNKGRFGSSFILFLMITSSFSMLPLQINIIRNGLALAFLMIALYYLLSKQNKLAILFILISFLFHRTIVIPILLITVILFLGKKISIKYYCYLYVLAVLLAFLNFGFHSIAFLKQSTFEDIQTIGTTQEHEYITGFRLDFVLYNSFFLVLFLKFSKMSSPKNIFLIKYYVLASIIFFMNFQIPFSDRVGIYSWIVIPLLLFNLINTAYGRTKLMRQTIVLILFFILNQIILFS